LQPKIIQQKEVRKREAKEIVSEISPERDLVFNRKKPLIPKGPSFGIKIKKLDSSKFHNQSIEPLLSGREAHIQPSIMGGSKSNTFA
jgi:hypothetical protein